MLKLKIKKPKPESSSAPPSSPPVSSSSSTGGGVAPEKKIKFKITRPKQSKQPPSSSSSAIIPPSSPSSTTSTPKPLKTTIKAPTAKVKKQGIKLKLVKGKGNTGLTPKAALQAVRKIRIKPTRIPGDGYDSEASDIEDDPLIEEAIILRLLPDAELDYVRHCVETGDFKNFHIKWKDRYRAIVHTNNNMYAAKLMKLPNIIEAQKTLDKKNLFKAADISQILLVVKKIESENEIGDITVDENEVYHSGITPPMANVSKTRFRKKLTKSHIEKLEAKVDELLRLDREAEETTYDYVDAESILQQEAMQSAAPTPAAAHRSGNTTAQEDDIMEDIDDLADDLELELEQALEDDGEGEEDNDNDNDNDNENDDDEDDDDDDNESENDGVMSRKVEVDEEEQHNALLKDEVNELITTIGQHKLKVEKTTNNVLKNRFVDAIHKLEKELENKMRQLKTSEDKARQRDQENEDEDEEDEEDNANDNENDDDDDDEDDNDNDNDGQNEDEDDEEDNNEDLFGDNVAEDQTMGGMDDNDDAIAALGLDNNEDDDLEDLFG
ncbi:hypothetical protein WICPIJ_008767 [Wickerhamomyces pijperi]|uniref:TAFII55 protein conserved region domain-containing protein n=1 Tax=Wickerhamomyces pijperi TaxID=599730 RepID=A0A9P8PX23_WICPI|nr:hypothetical protein WICPIJ_008767 [Wickerhamomyces pijperi]